jgi:RHS repeat-associated protein
MRYGNGLRVAYDYDLDGRLSTLQGADALHLDYRYDALGNITAITDNLDPSRSQSFAYDALDRLIHDAGAYGQHQYRYDALGNRTQRLSTVAHPHRRARHATPMRAQQYRYGEQSNRLTHIDGKPLRYDPAGHLTSDRSARHRYGYNQAGRLSRFSGPRAAKVSYVYNGKGQRVLKQTQGNKAQQRTHYHYAPDGRLLAESRYGHRGRLKTQLEYLWLNHIPLAQIRTHYRRNGSIQSRQRIYLHSDHLHTPRLATDARQRVVWRWDTEAFGQSKANTDPDGDGKKVNVNLRFPGQYYDRESGLHYNYFRDYDPRTGRYIQSDPIGLRGGLNTYAYAVSNPINFVDPFGLESISIGFGGGFHYGPGGANASTSVGMDSSGKVCIQFTKCGQVGFGLQGGLGASASVSQSDFCEGDSSSEGFFGEGALVYGGGVSASRDADGNAAGSAAKGIVGAGAAAGKQFCTTRTVCFN